MIKFVGHTMAVPGIEIVDAISIFSEIGLNGIENCCARRNYIYTN